MGVYYRIAMIICSCTGARALTSGFPHGDLRQQIWLDDVQCRGNEQRLIECPANPLGSHNCGHFDDAGVSCLANITSSCSEGDIRLQGGSETHGRVEVCVVGIWGTVCNDLWGPFDAQVACRQLGFSANGNITGHSYGVRGGGNTCRFDST